jgi:cell division protein FtsW
MGSGYQMQQILIVIGSGGFWGKGFGQSRQRFGYLVENTAHTDSIFAVILEELGLWGGALIVFSWIFFLWRGFKIALSAADREGQLLATGITIWLTCQAFFNMAANVGLIPLTGIPLPFLTYGGSSTIVTLIAFGLLLNVSRYTKHA